MQRDARNNGNDAANTVTQGTAPLRWVGWPCRATSMHHAERCKGQWERRREHCNPGNSTSQVGGLALQTVRTCWLHAAGRRTLACGGLPGLTETRQHATCKGHTADTCIQQGDALIHTSLPYHTCCPKQAPWPAIIPTHPSTQQPTRPALAVSCALPSSQLRKSYTGSRCNCCCCCARRLGTAAAAASRRL
jgi:hypothetical protein